MGGAKPHYAAPPGTGPAGETCRRCARSTYGRDPRPFKQGIRMFCGIVPWGLKAPIRPGSPACAQFVPTAGVAKGAPLNGSGGNGRASW